jgi:hypothetical protein
MVPPHNLVLTGCDFHPFSVQRNTSPDYLHSTGSQLSLRDRGQALQHDFEASIIANGLEPLLHHKSWQIWADCLERAVVDSEVVKKWVAEHEQWWAAIEQRRATGGACAGLSS